MKEFTVELSLWKEVYQRLSLERSSFFFPVFLIFNPPISFFFHKYDVCEWSDLNIFLVPEAWQYFYTYLPFDKSSPAGL